MDVVLVAPAAIDVDPAQGLQVALVSVDEMDRVVVEPALPALFDELTRLEVERQAEAERRVPVGIVCRRHADVHDRVSLRVRELFLAPYGIEKAAHAAIVEAFAPALAQRVEFAGLALHLAELGELVERVRPVVPVDEIEVRVSGVIGDGAPVLRVFHSMDDCAVSTGRFSEASAMLAAA